MSAPCVLAIDIGSSSARTALFDLRGQRRIESTAQIHYQLRYTADGGAELAPELMRDSVGLCLQRTLRKQKGAVMAVGVSCFWHALLGTDAKGRPLTPIYTWAESRCQANAARLRQKASERAMHARTGCMLRSSYWPAKLLWLKRRKVKATRWLSPGEWLLWQLGGEPRCSLSMASGTGLLNIAKLDWDERALELSQVKRTQLSPLSDEPLRCSSISALRDVQWFPAIGDGAAGNLGSDATQSGVAAINFGTSAAVRLVWPAGKAPFGLFHYRIDADRVLIGGAISNAGNLRAWCLKELSLRKDLPARTEGLIVLPFWAGERAPTWPEGLKGAVTGLTQATTGNDILQAATDATFYRLADIAQMLGAKQYVISGGLTKSAPELQRLADVLERELTVCVEPESSLRGAALFALEKLGMQSAPLPRGRVIKPRRAFANEHADRRAKQRELEQRLRRTL